MIFLRRDTRCVSRFGPLGVGVVGLYDVEDGWAVELKTFSIGAFSVFSTFNSFSEMSLAMNSGNCYWQSIFPNVIGSEC